MKQDNLLVQFLLLLLFMFGLWANAQAQTASFAAPVKFATGGDAPTAVAVGDFNADSKLDLVLTNQNTHNVSLLQGNGDGTFTATATFPVGYSPRSIAPGDFNKDGKVDLVVGNETGGDLSVLINNGGGSFNGMQSYGPVDLPEDVAVVDLNLDGNLDLAVAGFGGSAFVLVGNGDGTFQAPLVYPTGKASRSVVSSDFNKDGKPDLGVANQDDSNISVLLGNGDGTFSASMNYATGPFPASIKVGDFNRDGNIDLVTADIGTNPGASNGFVSVSMGNGDGTFQVAVAYSVGLVPYSIITGDFNSDGLNDLAIANVYSNTISILAGNADGSFQTPANYSTGDPSTPFSVAVGDFNGDGLSDLATANFNDDSTTVLINNTSPMLQTSGGNPGQKTTKLNNKGQKLRTR